MASQTFETRNNVSVQWSASSDDVSVRNDDGERSSRTDKKFKTYASMQMHLQSEGLHQEIAASFKARILDQPWLDEDEGSWSIWRIWVAKVVLSTYAEYALTALILFNVCLIIFETDQEAKCHPKFKSDLSACPTSQERITWLIISNTALLTIYTIEAALKIFALRLMYFRSRSHMFDLILCAGGWLPLMGIKFVKVSWLRVFKCIRLLRAAKFVDRVPELSMLFHGFMGSMRAMFFGMLMLLALLCFFSILVVQFVHPQNCQLNYEGCSRCAKGFESVAASMLTLYQQIVAGDSWGLISIPVLENSYMGLLLPAIHLVIALGAMNLVLGVVVDQAMEARESNRVAQAEKKAQTHKLRKLQLLELVRLMDGDESGDINRDEIYESVHTNTELQTRLALVGLRLDELAEIVEALTSNGDETSISYKSICNVFDDIDAADLRKNIVLTKLVLSSMHRDINKRLDQQSVELINIARQLAEINAGHSAQAHADNKQQERTAPAPPWHPPFEHDRPRNVSTCDVDVRLQKSITDAFVLCEVEMDSERKRVQQSLLQLDAKWAACLRALEETLFSWADSCEPHEPNARFLDNAKRSHQTLEWRQNRYCKDLMNALKDDFSFSASQSSIHSANDSVRAAHERDSYRQLISSPRLPRAPWKNSPRDVALQTPRTAQQVISPRLPRALWWNQSPREILPQTPRK